MSAAPADGGGARGGTRADAASAVALFAAVVLYLALLPLNPSIPDEGHALFAAKRLAGGEAMYRDIFDLSTPGWPYLMAALFGLFGTTLAVARGTAAAIHGAVAVCVFLVCRQLGVRRGLAGACGLAYVALAHPLFPVASYHWLATLLCVLLALLCLRDRGGVAGALAIGLVAGLLIAVHQQRGAAMGLGVAVLFALEAVLRRRYGRPPPPAPLWSRLAVLAGGALLVVVPMLAVVVARAGLPPVWDALIVFPLVSYRGAHGATPWGFEWYAGRRGHSAVAIFLRYLPPAALALAAAGLARLAVPGRSYERARALLALAVLGGFSIASILYYPDVIHIAFIAPLFFVMLADAGERALRALPPGPGRAIGAGAAAALILAAGWQMSRYAARLRAAHPVRYDSAFGRLDLRTRREARLWEQLRRLLDASPARTLYAFPMSYYAYLIVDARNPTRHAFVVPGSPYTPDAYLREIVDTLRSERVPYVFMERRLRTTGDPVTRFVREHYEQLSGPQPLASVLWRRKVAEAHGGDTTTEDAT